MKILDSTALIYSMENAIQVRETYLITPDLEAEFDVSEIHFRAKRSKSIKLAKDQLANYDEAYYLQQYRSALNKHGGCSLVKMRDVGDTSILALIRSVIDNFGKSQLGLAFLDQVSTDITVYTNDGGLIKKLQSEFGGQITIRKNEDIV